MVRLDTNEWWEQSEQEECSDAAARLPDQPSLCVSVSPMCRCVFLVVIVCAVCVR